jgi:hypothetical protein
MNNSNGMKKKNIRIILDSYPLCALQNKYIVIKNIEAIERIAQYLITAELDKTINRLNDDCVWATKHFRVISISLYI